jgi:S1-C subfamily serine protease
MAPVVTPTTSTTFSSGSATAFGSGGTATAFGTGQSTTYGTETTMVPYTISRTNFHAFFWYKAKRSRLGIDPIPPDDSTRQRLGSNAGIVVKVVVEDTTAYAADVLPGDIVISIGGDTVYSVGSFYKLLDKYEDQEPVFIIDRSGNRIQKTIKILALAR